MATSHFFGTLGKFSDGTGIDLIEYLSRFDRCCVVANKMDAENSPVKGQLLMLHVEGRARTALEEYELSQGGVPQPYATLKQQLLDCFVSTSARETS